MSTVSRQSSALHNQDIAIELLLRLEYNTPYLQRLLLAFDIWYKFIDIYIMSLIKAYGIMNRTIWYITIFFFGFLLPMPLRAQVQFDFRARTAIAGLTETTLASFTAVATDLNLDGWLEVLGSMNDARGRLQWLSLETLGLQKLVAENRKYRDARIADVNGDGLPDVISNTYACNGDTESQALLFLNDGNGGFREDLSFSQLPNLRGFGETIVVADFDNDGDLDIYLPFYTRPDVPLPNLEPPNSNGFDCRLVGGGTPESPPQPPSFVPSSRLLKNNAPFRLADGQEHFTDITTSAGVSLQDLRSQATPPEGAQAVDINQDGHVDLYVAGHLFVNNGDLTFTDVSAQKGLLTPGGNYIFDEGAAFLDWNNDGQLDLVLMSVTGPRLFQWNGPWATGSFVDRSSLLPAGLNYEAAYGLNAYDLDNDGREDIVTMGGAARQPRILVNTPTRFVLGVAPALQGLGNGRGGPAFGDIDRDGKIDLLYPTDTLVYFRNATPLPATHRSFTVEILDHQGQRNQQGHVVKVFPPQTAQIFTRVVNGGAGYMAQNQYPLLIGTPFRGVHTVEAIYAPTPRCGNPCKVRATVRPGEHVKMYGPSALHPHGRAEVALSPAPSPPQFEWLRPVLDPLLNLE